MKVDHVAGVTRSVERRCSKHLWCDAATALTAAAAWGATMADERREGSTKACRRDVSLIGREKDRLRGSMRPKGRKGETARLMWSWRKGVEMRWKRTMLGEVRGTKEVRWEFGRQPYFAGEGFGGFCSTGGGVGCDGENDQQQHRRWYDLTVKVDGKGGMEGIPDLRRLPSAVSSSCCRQWSGAATAVIEGVFGLVLLDNHRRKNEDISWFFFDLL
ncbi:unnamed protein product [Lactuca saligna]|uniref:Uncharacterized protein n=1 Tax=Lactuca saligna TaxID=75948 RepID=A0AA35ZHI7_LACSI|nr:unnamed protein product [Lactuca saligna]